MLRFNFDAQAGETPASIAQKRALVAQIMGTARTPQTFGEGLSALGDGIVANVLGGRAADAEKAGQSSANDTFSQLVASITGQGWAPIPTGPATATDATAALAAVPSGERAAYIRSGLVNRGLPEHVADAFLLNMQDESGLDPGINEAQPLVPGSRGGYGLYQLTGPRRTAYEAFAGERGVDPSDIDAQLDFLMTELQGPEANAYRSIMSAQDTPTAAAAIVNEFLRPAEVNRARREASYLGGQSQLPELSALMEAASNPWLSDSQKSVINSMIAQQMQAADPAYQQSLRAGELGIQKAELELEQLRNKPPPLPGAPKTEKIYDPETGREKVVQWNESTGAWEDLGGVSAPKEPLVQVNTGDGAPGLGKLSTDYGYVLDPVTGQPVIDPATGLPTAAPVPGSPAAVAAQRAATQAGVRQDQSANAANIVLEDIDRALGQVSGWTAGAGSLLSNIPGTGAVDLSSSLDTIKANIGFDRLQQMREASPTGGALGGIAVEELRMLQSVMGSLNTAQTPEQLKANLERLKQVYEPIAAKAAAYPNAGQFGFGGGPSLTPPAEPTDIDALLEKYQ